MATSAEDKVARLLRSLKGKGMLSSSAYEQLLPTGSGPGVLYGLLKVHKSNVPLRPILAAYNTASYKFVKNLVPLLEPFTHSSFTLKNSYDFFHSVSAFDLPEESFLCSFDVSSFFTNVPLAEIIEIICSCTFDGCASFHGFDLSSFRKLLSTGVSDPLFLFNAINIILRNHIQPLTALLTLFIIYLNT